MRELIHKSAKILFHRQTHILSAAVVIMGTFALSHLVGLIKTRLLISYFFGSSAPLLDVYYAAFILPDTVFQLLVIGSLSAAFIPVFTRYLNKEEKSAWGLASSSLNLVLLVFIAISLFMALFSSSLARIVGPGFSPDQLSLLSSLIRILLIAQFFFSISGFLTAMIQSHQRFLIPALAPVVYNLGIILGIVLLSPVLGIYGPAVGVIIGAIFHMGIQLPLAFKLGFRPKLTLNLFHPGVREVARLMPPRAIALGVDQIEQLVAVVVASTLSVGSLSLLNVARLLYSIPSSLFGVTIGQAAFPALSRLSTEDRRTYTQTFVDSLLQIVFLALPVSVLFIVLRIPIVRLVFGAKTFPWAATLLTGKTLAILSASATFAAAQAFISRGFYSLHDTKTPLKIGIIAALLGSLAAVLISIVLKLELTGLAIVMSLTTVIECSALFLLFSRNLKFDSFGQSHYIYKLVIPMAKMLITSFIMGLSLWVPMRLLDQFVFDTTRTIPLFILTCISSIIGISVYLFLSFLFRVDELGSFLSMFARLKNWRQFITPLKSPEPIILPVEDQN